MIKFKIDIGDALFRAGYRKNTPIAWKNVPDDGTKPISKDSLLKIIDNEPSLTLATLNKICAILDMQPKDLIEYTETDDDKLFVDHFRAVRPKKQYKVK